MADNTNWQIKDRSCNTMADVHNTTSDMGSKLRLLVWNFLPVSIEYKGIIALAFQISLIAAALSIAFGGVFSALHGLDNLLNPE